MSFIRQRVTVLYEGHVQGVGFRYTTLNVAKGYEVIGTVRNLPDGRVELVAEGEKEELDSFLEGIRESGLGGNIRNEETDFEQAQGGFKGFSIVN